MNFGPYPEKRELPSFVQKQSGEELALKLLRQHDALDSLHRKELSDVQKQADRLAEQLALLVHKKRFTENDPFVMSLRQLLKNEGIILHTYVGEEVTDTLEDEADIVEWLPPGEDTVDRVEDALEPEILWHGQLLHRAKLSCRQAAGETAENETEEAPEELTGGEAVSKSAFPEAEEIEPAETAEESPIEEPAESSEEIAGAAAELAEAAEETDSEEPEEMPEEAAGAAEEAAETAEGAEEPADDSIDDEEDSDEENSDEEDFDDEEDEEESGFFRRILDRISSWLSGES